MSARTKASEQLLSTDTHTNTANYKFTYSIEIAPICKDDLVCIPPKLARSLSSIEQLTICTRVGNSMHLIDPSTLQVCEVSAPVYWRTPFDALATVIDLVEFIVLDIEPSGPTRGKWVLADAQVAMSGAFKSTGGGANYGMEYEGGSEGQIYHTRTHLGAILQPGDSALGYHLTRTNFNSEDYAVLDQSRIPDVMLVKKAYPNRRKKSRPRNWQLKSMAKDTEEGMEAPTNVHGAVGRMGGRDQKKVEEDYELFLRDLEEDVDMRQAVNMYMAPANGAGSGVAGGKTRRKGNGQFSIEVDVRGTQVQSAEVEIVVNETEDEAEADFPDVRLDELLEEFDEMTLNHDVVPEEAAS